VISSAVLWNPIITKEVRSRMRTWRAPVLVTLYLALLGGIGYLTFMSTIRSTTGGNPNPQAGISIFGVLVNFELLLIAFMTPALTAGAIAGERERQTLDLLLCTRVRPIGIILGKLLSSMLFVLLLLLLSVPLFSAVFLFGGIELDQVLIVLLIGLVTAVTLASLGLLCSTIARRATGATVASYALAFLLLFGTLLTAQLTYNPNPSSNKAQLLARSLPVTPDPPAYIFASPVTAIGATVPQSFLASMVGMSRFGIGSSGYGYSGSYTSTTSTGPDGRVMTSTMPVQVSPNTRTAADVIPRGLFKKWHVWQAFTLINLVLAALALGVSVGLLRGRNVLPRRPVRSAAGETAWVQE
jgi:ABC-type transport system involved in multi-copper enzyme maturation permease subunit